MVNIPKFFNIKSYKSSIEHEEVFRQLSKYNVAQKLNKMQLWSLAISYSTKPKKKRVVIENDKTSRIENFHSEFKYKT